jgi:HSP90 family molecular chaperone
MTTQQKKLHLKFHGKILDQLGFQTYQSPVASIAELVSNSWDADAETVKITIPAAGTEQPEIVIKDTGSGMTFKECEEKYLNVGWNRRGDNPVCFTPKGRPVLGRKGIGKFAGFGIAEIIYIETISEETGEKTSFEMNIKQMKQEKMSMEQL